MKSRLGELGPLSDLAATYLEGTQVRGDPILEAEVERRQAENDITAAMIAIKRGRTERRSFTPLEQSLLVRAEDHVRRGVQPPRCSNHSRDLACAPTRRCFRFPTAGRVT